MATELWVAAVPEPDQPIEVRETIDDAYRDGLARDAGIPPVMFSGMRPIREARASRMRTERRIAQSIPGIGAALAQSNTITMEQDAVRSLFGGPVEPIDLATCLAEFTVCMECMQERTIDIPGAQIQMLLGQPKDVTMFVPLRIFATLASDPSDARLVSVSGTVAEGTRQLTPSVMYCQADGSTTTVLGGMSVLAGRPPVVLYDGNPTIVSAPSFAEFMTAGGVEVIEQRLNSALQSRAPVVKLPAPFSVDTDDARMDEKPAQTAIADAVVAWTILNAGVTSESAGAGPPAAPYITKEGDAAFVMTTPAHVRKTLQRYVKSAGATSHGISLSVPRALRVVIKSLVSNPVKKALVELRFIGLLVGPGASMTASDAHAHRYDTAYRI